MAKESKIRPIADWRTNANGHLTKDAEGDDKTDYARWRLHDNDGRLTWRYLETDEENEKWPQTFYDKYNLGLPTGAPELPKARTPLDAATNGLEFFSKLQMPTGHWACEYGGPMFLLPGVVITWYITNTPIPPEYAVEIKRYLFARQNPVDGGWGLHIEGHSSAFGTVMTYVILRILGASEEDPRMIKARGFAHKLGGALYAPHWAKVWLSLLGVMDWSCANPVPPELWLLPDWVPIAPYRWWVHMRMVFLPMSYLWSKKWVFPQNELTRQLRNEIYAQPYESIDFASHRNSIAKEDNYYPKTMFLNVVNSLLVNVWTPLLRFSALAKKAEDWVWELIRMEDENTDYAGLAPVSNPLNFVCCYIHDGEGSESVRKHREALHEYLWMKGEGMLCNGTNGAQVWDTAFITQAVSVAGFAEDTKWRPMLTKALEFLDNHQLRENVPNQDKCYRQHRKGAWPFSNKVQGYTVSDCTAEGLRSVLQLQEIHGYPKLVSPDRLKNAVDCILLLQNATGGFSEYESRRGSPLLEWLNAAEVFGGIMISYDHVECTTASITAMSLFSRFYPDYRAEEIKAAKHKAVEYIKRVQKPDGSWYEPIRRGIKLLMSRQQANGEWLQESIEGVFNMSCMISYPNYKFYWPIRALEHREQYDNMAVAPGSTLGYLRTRSLVDCDTLDAKVAQALGPFQDCTSNQAIALFELSKPEHKELLAESHLRAGILLKSMAETKDPRFAGIELDELAVEIATVKVAIQITPHLQGKMHIQTNPYYAYSTDKTVANAFRIVYLFNEFAPNWDSSRICIKIPSTWEGMLACRTLQLAGVHTLATTLFSMPQAILAAEVGCTYVAPYVNQLKVHFEPGFVDPNKLFSLCVAIQKYYKSVGAVTQVLPASLTSTDEVLALAGVDHITVAPPLLELLSLPDCPITPSFFDSDTSGVLAFPKTPYLKDEAAYRIAFTRDLAGASEEKLTQAINIFCDMQDKLIALIKSKSE
ncbi:hypothetical protein ZTR_07860 [Talaromyces verruculosus]|nr:hypothetical protein ZTR_07860 [Talaromyces verruculosus]